MVNMLHLGLSYSCNMKCNHCYVNKANDKLTIDDIKRCIDILLEKGLLIVFYTFGEPLISPIFSEIVEYLNKKNVVQILMSNGTLISQKNIEFMKKNSIEKIYISFDSTNPEIHDKNRNYKGAFCKAKHAVELLINNDIKVGLAITINDTNVKEMDNFVKFALKNNIESISFLRQRDQSSNVKLSNYDIYENFYVKYLEQRNRKIFLQFHDPELLKITKSLFELEKITKDDFYRFMEMNRCNIRNTISIAPNGDVLLCNLVNKKIGNICDENLEDILKRRDSINECFICYSKFSR